MVQSIEKYYAQSGSEQQAAAFAAGPSPFLIEVRFLGGLNTAQKAAFKTAANRWTSVIRGDLPSVVVDGETIDDVVILAQGSPIDGPGRVLGQAGPTALRPASTKPHSLLPAKGVMTFDTADLAAMEADGTLVDVITHEMGHVLGIGTLWEDKGLVSGVGSSNPVFTGAQAKTEWGTLRGKPPANVPVEAKGGQGTRDSHWRDSVFVNELMTGFVNTGKNPLSRLTIASLGDLGYEVDLGAADPFELPDVFAFAIEGRLDVPSRGEMLRFIPLVLPDDSVV